MDKSEPLDKADAFDSIFLEAIDETLLAYGEETRSAFFDYLKEAAHIPKRKIPLRIDDFIEALEDLFGKSSKSFEIHILKNLHSKVGVVWELKAPNPWILPDLTFKEYVNRVKAYFEDNDKYEDKLGVFVSRGETLQMYK
jgi:hypothetical protein